MELYAEILAHYLSRKDAQITFPNLEFSAKEIIQLQCYQALHKIKAIIQDETLADAECFARIEQIICTLEELGSNGGTRHDFG